jgi:hypothetical protein
MKNNRQVSSDNSAKDTVQYMYIIYIFLICVYYMRGWGSILTERGQISKKKLK